MNKRWMKVRRKITERDFFKKKRTGEDINQSVIEQGRVESMRGYQEGKFGRR